MERAVLWVEKKLFNDLDSLSFGIGWPLRYGLRIKIFGIYLSGRVRKRLSLTSRMSEMWFLIIQLGSESPAIVSAILSCLAVRG